MMKNRMMETVKFDYNDINIKQIQRGQRIQGYLSIVISLVFLFSSISGLFIFSNMIFDGLVGDAKLIAKIMECIIGLVFLIFSVLFGIGACIVITRISLSLYYDRYSYDIAQIPSYRKFNKQFFNVDNQYEVKYLHQLLDTEHVSIKYNNDTIYVNISDQYKSLEDNLNLFNKSQLDMIDDVINQNKMDDIRDAIQVANQYFRPVVEYRTDMESTSQMYQSIKKANERGE